MTLAQAWRGWVYIKRQAHKVGAGVQRNRVTYAHSQGCTVQLHRPRAARQLLWSAPSTCTNSSARHARTCPALTLVHVTSILSYPFPRTGTDALPACTANMGDLWLLAWFYVH